MESGLEPYTGQCTGTHLDSVNTAHHGFSTYKTAAVTCSIVRCIEKDTDVGVQLTQSIAASATCQQRESVDITERPAQVA